MLRLSFSEDYQFFKVLFPQISLRFYFFYLFERESMHKWGEEARGRERGSSRLHAECGAPRAA